MEKRTTVLVSVLFVLVIIGMFAFTYLKNQEQQAVDQLEPAPTSDVDADTGVDNNYDITNITATRFFEDGTHTLVGAVTLPTPCDLLEVEAQILESMPEQVIFDFTVLNTADTCAQVMTEQRFMVSAEASELADLQATFMGRPVELNITEAAPGETPEDFELFIKG